MTYGVRPVYRGQGKDAILALRDCTRHENAHKLQVEIRGALKAALKKVREVADIAQQEQFQQLGDSLLKLDCELQRLILEGPAQVKEGETVRDRELAVAYKKADEGFEKWKKDQEKRKVTN